MRLTLGFLILCAAAVATLAGCATSRSTPDVLAEDSAWLDQAVAALERRGDPGSLVAVALLSESPIYGLDRPDSVAINALRAAAVAAPENRGIAALRLLVCLAANECNATEAADGLQRIDPANGATLLPKLQSALRSGNADAIDAALAELAGAATVNLYQNPNVVFATDALDGADLPRHPESPEFEVISYLSAAMVGAYPLYEMSLFYGSGTVSEICRDAVAGSARHGNCVKAFELIMSADTSTLQILGASLTCRIAPADSESVAKAREFMRQFEWTGNLLSEAMGASSLAEIDPDRVHQFLSQQHEAMRRHAREDDARRAHLISMGMDPDPPADWMPKKESAIGNAMAKCGLG